MSRSQLAALLIALILQAPSGAQVAPNPAPAPIPIPPAVTERNIYLPYEDLDKLFEKEGRGVFLPYKEFLDLRNQLQLKEQQAANPPADGVFKAATYQATVEGKDEAQVLVIQAKLELESFQKSGWATVPLGKIGSGISEAQTGNARLRLGPDGYEALLPAAGVYEIALKMVAPITRKDGDRAVKLQLPQTPVSRVEATIPEQGWQFNLSEGVAYTSTPQGPNTKLEFFFGNLPDISLSWKKQGEETSLTALLFAETTAKAKVLPGALQTQAAIHYRILRAGVDSFEIAVPKPHEVLAVEGANIQEWNVAEEGETQKLSIKLFAPAKNEYQLDLTLETSLATLPAAIQVPKLETTGAVRQSGTIELTASPDLKVDLAGLEGLTQQTAGAGQTEDGQAKMGAYRFLRTPYVMALNVQKADPVVQVDSETMVTVRPETTELRTLFRYQVKRAGIFETTIQIPAGFEGYSVIGDVVDNFGINGNNLLVSFKERQASSFTLILNARAPRASEAEALTVPVYIIAGAERHDAKVGLAIHTSLEPTTDDPGGMRPEPVSSMSREIGNFTNIVDTSNVLRGNGNIFQRQMGNVSLTVAGSPSSDAPLTTAFAYRGTVAPAKISFRVKESQVTARVTTKVDVQEQLVRFRWTLDYSILYSGIDQLVLRLPKAIAANLRVENGAYKELNQNFQPPGAPNPPNADVVHWAITLRNKTLGDYKLELSLDQPQAGQAFEFTVPEIAVVGVFKEDGQIAVSKGDNLELTEKSQVGLESIDPRELTSLPDQGVLRAYKYQQHPIALSLSALKSQFLGVPRLVVTYADATSVVSSDAGITTEVVYWVRNNAEPSLRVKLPENARLLSDVFVRDQSQLPMQQAGSAEMFIRLPSGAEARERSFPVRFVYELPSPQPGRKLGSNGRIEVPVAEATNPGIAVMQSRVQLYLPEGYKFTRFDGPMQRPANAWGWGLIRREMDSLLPAIGPGMETGQATPPQGPEQIPAASQAAFHVPIVKEGQLFPLYRLDQPAAITVSFRDQSFGNVLEFILGFFAFAFGAMLTGRSLGAKFAYFIFVGLLSLGLAMLVSPFYSELLQAVFIGVMCAVAWWLAAGFWWLIRPGPDPLPVMAGGVPPMDPPVEPEPPKAKPEPAPEPTPEPESKPVLDLDFKDEPAPKPKAADTPPPDPEEKIVLDLPTEPEKPKDGKP